MDHLLPSGANHPSLDEGGVGHDDPGQAAAIRATALGSASEDSSRNAADQMYTVGNHYLDKRQRIRAPTATQAASVARVTADDVTSLAKAAVFDGAAAAMQLIDQLRARGTTLEAIYLDLLGPAARHLGVLWDEDECDFADVTIGLGHLHQILRDLGPQFRIELQCVNLGRRLLLVPSSGEHHTFGLLMVADFFIRGGWNVWEGDGPVGTDLFRLVRDEWFDAVGLGVGCGRRLEMVAADISAIRATSRNKAVKILAGGPALVSNPELAALIGADATALDGREALREAERLMASPSDTK